MGGKRREQDHQHLSLRSCRHLSCHLSVEDPREGGRGGCGGGGGGRVQEHLVRGKLEGQLRRRTVVVAVIVLVLEVLLLLRGRRHRSEEGAERGTRRSNTTRSSALRLSKVLFSSTLFFFLFSLSFSFFLLWQPTTKGRKEKRREEKGGERDANWSQQGEREKGQKQDEKYSKASIVAGIRFFLLLISFLKMQNKELSFLKNKLLILHFLFDKNKKTWCFLIISGHI